MGTIIKKLKILRLYIIKQRLSNMLYEIECELMGNISLKHKDELINEYNEVLDTLSNID